MNKIVRKFIEAAIKDAGWKLDKDYTFDIWLSGEELSGSKIKFAKFENYVIRVKKPINYKEYIQSPEWKVKAKDAKVLAQWRCQLCNKEGDDYTLHAHHRTYERLGSELPGDITVLCSDCHAKYHGKDKEDA